MRSRYIVAAVALLVSACTFTPRGDSLQPGFNPPLVYRQWDMRPYMLKNGAPACEISSGYNGLSVLVSRKDVAVKGTRPMVPGAMLNVTIGDTNYQTYEEFFPDTAAPRVVDALSRGDKAYLEWSEYSGYWGGAPVRVQNILKLDGFRQQLEKCRASLKGGA